MGQLDLVFAPALRPVFGAADLPVATLERLAEKAGLPGSIVDGPQGFVPLHATELFLELVQRESGERTFLFDSLTLDQTERAQTQSVVGVPLPTGATGKEALGAMTQVFNSFISGARFGSVIKGRHFWVMRTAAATEWSDQWSVLQYNLSIMLSGARRILDPGLTPVALRLPFAPGESSLPEGFRHLPLTLDRTHFGMAFDLGDIVALESVSQPDHLTDASRADPVSDRMPDALAACMAEFVASSPGDCSAHRIAAAFGMSERSYRRKLAAFGESHHGLLSNARLDLARTMLGQHSASVTDIAYGLGYANPGDFTRFFKRRMGCTPQQYRRLRA